VLSFSPPTLCVSSVKRQQVTGFLMYELPGTRSSTIPCTPGQAGRQADAWHVWNNSNNPGLPSG
jgi:hypothetical protein